MEIILTERAKKDMEKLDEKMKQRVYKKIDDLERRKPNLNLRKLQGKHGDLRLKVGRYRIVHTIINDKIYITNILPRKDVYKKI